MAAAQAAAPGAQAGAVGSQEAGSSGFQWDDVVVELIPCCAHLIQEPIALERGGEPVILGRSHQRAYLSDPQVSRAHVSLGWKRTKAGDHALVLATLGRNSVRILSPGRRKQSKVPTGKMCRVLMGDVIELVYDQPGRHAFQVMPVSRQGVPMLPSSPPRRLPRSANPSVACFPGPQQGVPFPLIRANHDKAWCKWVLVRSQIDACMWCRLPMQASPSPAARAGAAGTAATAAFGEGNSAVVASPMLGGKKRARSHPASAVGCPSPKRGPGLDGMPSLDLGPSCMPDELEGGCSDSSPSAEASAVGSLVGLPSLPGRSPPAEGAGARTAPPQLPPTQHILHVNFLPPGILEHALSYLQLHESLLASRVCRAWLAAAQQPRALPGVALGQYFRGTSRPHPTTLANLAGSVTPRVRHLSLAFCAWATVGDVLALLGLRPALMAPTAVPGVKEVAAPLAQRGVDDETAVEDFVQASAGQGSALQGADFVPYVSGGQGPVGRVLECGVRAPAWSPDVPCPGMRYGQWYACHVSGCTAPTAGPPVETPFAAMPDEAAKPRLVRSLLGVAVSCLWQGAQLEFKLERQLWACGAGGAQGGAGEVLESVAATSAATAAGGLPANPWRPSVRDAFPQSKFCSALVDLMIPWYTAEAVRVTRGAQPSSLADAGVLCRNPWLSLDGQSSGLGATPLLSLHLPDGVHPQAILEAAAANMSHFLPLPAHEPTPVETRSGGLPRLTQPLPAATFASHVQVLDLRCCLGLCSENLALLARYTPVLRQLRLRGCSQLAARDIAAAVACLPHLEVLDVEYVVGVDDSVLHSLAAHCPRLHTLKATGCERLTDAAFEGVEGGPPGLAAACPRLTHLQLRGCSRLSDATLQCLSRHCHGLKQVVLLGLRQLTVPALAQLVLACPGLAILKAEMWFRAQPPEVLAQHPAELLKAVTAFQAAGDEGGEEAEPSPSSSVAYRIVRDVPSAVRYALLALPPGDASYAGLQELAEARGLRTEHGALRVAPLTSLAEEEEGLEG